MTDRELLEMAAKAAGIELYVWNDFNGVEHYAYLDAKPYGAIWNPLKNDGDALRLAVELRLQINPGKHKGDGCTVETQRDGIAGCTAFYDDKAQQMRQAIVHAAAEIGKAMP